MNYRKELPLDGVSRFNHFKEFLPVCRETWRKLVLSGKAPAPIRLSERCTVWRNVDLHAWFKDPLAFRAEDLA